MKSAFLRALQLENPVMIQPLHIASVLGLLETL